MSAVGHQRTWRLRFVMSALTQQADINHRLLHVRLGPKRDMRTRLGNVRSYSDIRHWLGYLWAIRQNPTIDTFEALGTLPLA
jgi:hypothetical protein